MRKFIVCLALTVVLALGFCLPCCAAWTEGQSLQDMPAEYAEMLQGEYGHALYECRRVLEETLKQHIKHSEIWRPLYE